MGFAKCAQKISIHDQKDFLITWSDYVAVFFVNF